MQKILNSKLPPSWWNFIHQALVGSWEEITKKERLIY